MDGVGYLTLVTGGKVAVLNNKSNRGSIAESIDIWTSEDNDNRGLLELYNLNNVQLIWHLTSEGMKGMTEVFVDGKHCLAISLRYIC